MLLFSGDVQLPVANRDVRASIALSAMCPSTSLLASLPIPGSIAMNEKISKCLMGAIIAFYFLQPAAISAETQWFTISLPDGWTITDGKDDKDDVVVTDASQTQRFQISVNKKSNSFIMCFCAPMDKYEKFFANGFSAARLNHLGTLTVKVSGTRYSTDVHYLLKNNNEDAEIISTIESIRPK